MELKVLRQQRDALDDQIQRLEWGLKYRATNGSGILGPEAFPPLATEASLNGSTDSAADDPAVFAELLQNLKEQVGGVYCCGEVRL